jgi:Tol biopolymer transport system component
MKPDGTEVKQLTNIGELKSDPNWLTDSKNVIFENKNHIYKLNIDTKNKIPLTVFKDSDESTPVQGQNEHTLIFSSNRTGNWELYMADFSNPEETRFTQLTNDSATDRYPAWYPCHQ